MFFCINQVKIVLNPGGKILKKKESQCYSWDNRKVPDRQQLQCSREMT